ncbi:MAG: hypothetical protein HUU34_14400 [Saprospiraceae bacterium]|nr:hypothetical protein [Saprospiraceae bacterium]
MNTSVIIIDNVVARRDKLSKLFIGSLSNVFTLIDHDICYWDFSLSDWLLTDEDIPHVDLMLIHGGDSGLKDCIPFKKRIWYSGNVGADSRAVPGEDFIYAAIDDGGKSSLDTINAEELLKYASGELSEKPKCLRTPYFDSKMEVILELLHTLSGPLCAKQRAFAVTQFATLERELSDNTLGQFITKKINGVEKLDPKTIREIRDYLFNKLKYA